MTRKKQVNYGPIWIGPTFQRRRNTETRGIEVQIEILGEAVEFFIVYVPGFATLGDLADGLYWLCDRTVEIVIGDIERRGETIPCRKGCCASCCRHLIPVSVAEAASLGRYLLGDIQAYIQCAERAHEMARRISVEFEKFKEQVNIVGMEYRELSERLNVWYEQIQVVCPMLVDHACCIYEYRPMICRQWGVVGGEEQCMGMTAGQKRTMPRPVCYSDILREVGMRLDLSANETVILPFALDWYEENREKCEILIDTERIVGEFLDVIRGKLHGKIKCSSL